MLNMPPLKTWRSLGVCCLTHMACWISQPSWIHLMWCDVMWCDLCMYIHIKKYLCICMWLSKCEKWILSRNNMIIWESSPLGIPTHLPSPQLWSWARVPHEQKTGGLEYSYLILTETSNPKKHHGKWMYMIANYVSYLFLAGFRHQSFLFLLLRLRSTEPKTISGRCCATSSWRL